MTNTIVLGKIINNDKAAFIESRLPEMICVGHNIVHIKAPVSDIIVRSGYTTVYVEPGGYIRNATVLDGAWLNIVGSLDMHRPTVQGHVHFITGI